MQPEVSVCIFSYNYERYIQQAVDSVLAQHAPFPIEIVIGDDCSTDATLSILQNYQREYPEIIRVIGHTKNEGGTKNWIRTINACRGAYIALLDGDDYFSDPMKLVKQHSLLECNPSSNLSFSSVVEKYDNRGGYEEVVSFPEDRYSMSDILKLGWFMRTSTLFFRNGILPEEPPFWVYQFPYRYDTILIAALCNGADALNYREPMTVWRRHQAGLSYAITRNVLQNYISEKALYEKLDLLYNKRYTQEINYYLRNVRTGVVFHSLKRANLVPLWQLGFHTLWSLNYSLLFRLIDRALRRKVNLLPSL